MNQVFIHSAQQEMKRHLGSPLAWALEPRVKRHQETSNVGYASWQLSPKPGPCKSRISSDSRFRTSNGRSNQPLLLGDLVIQGINTFQCNYVTWSALQHSSALYSSAVLLGNLSRHALDRNAPGNAHTLASSGQNIKQYYCLKSGRHGWCLNPSLRGIWPHLPSPLVS